MTPAQFDFLVIGSTPAARLVAGLLAATHGKTVAWKGESQSGYRLQRGFDLSLAAITRPETRSLMRSCLPEVTRLLSRIGGRGAWSRVDPVFFAQSPSAKEALGHIRHMAGAFGLETERLPSRVLGPDADVALLRDAVMINRRVLEPGLDLWLDRHKVHRASPEAVIALHEDGSATLNGPDGPYEARQTVLADDEAIMEYRQPAAWPDLLLRQAHSTVLMQSAQPLVAPVLHDLSTGLQLIQQRGGILADGPGTIDTVAGSLRALVQPQSQSRQAGQSHYLSLVSADGAPVAGKLRDCGPIILAGFGVLPAFLAPATARWLADRASNAEQAWFAARGADRTPASSPVAEWGCAG